MWGLAMIWPIGGVLLLALLLWLIRRPMRAGQSTALVDASRFVHSDYRTPFYGWEMINLCHRTVLTGWVLLIDDERAFLRLVLALFTSLLVCFFLLALRPYRKTSDLMLAASQQLLLVFLFLGAMTLRTRAVLAEQVSLDLILEHSRGSTGTLEGRLRRLDYLCQAFERRRAVQPSPLVGDAQAHEIRGRRRLFR